MLLYAACVMLLCCGPATTPAKNYCNSDPGGYLSSGLFQNYPHSNQQCESASFAPTAKGKHLISVQTFYIDRRICVAK